MPGKTSRRCRRAQASEVQNHERNTKLHLAKGRDEQNSLCLQARFARVNRASVALPDVDTEKLGCAKPALSGARAFRLQHCRGIQHHPTSLHQTHSASRHASWKQQRLYFCRSRRKQEEAKPARNERNTISRPPMRPRGFRLALMRLSSGSFLSRLR